MTGSTVVPLVGRSEELGRVLAALERAAAGSGGALLLAGEAGIGKSRLAAEALTLAHRREFVTLQAAAYPLQGDLAYAPVLELLGPFLAGLEPGRRAALVAGLPDLGRLFAGLHLPPPERLGDAALERTRMFEAVSRLVERAAAERPVALLVDDLHWADSASLELLHYLARGLGTQHVLLLGTYRLDEARTHPGLRALVRSLQRLGLAEELHVGGLGQEAVAALARDLLDGEPPAELLGVLHERAAGTPLFVGALIRGLRDTGELFHRGGTWVLGGGSPSTVPPVVRDLVLARLERLDPTDRALLELIAVAGVAASPALFSRVGVPAQGLEERLRRLQDAGLVVEEPAGSGLVHRAAHPLIAEVAYAELPELRRRRLHAGVASALEVLDPSDPQRLAHHYRGAAGEADPRRALDVLVAAAWRAEELHADAEAADLLAAALALARADQPAMVGELLERLGDAHSRAGQLDAAVAAWSEAAAGHERSGDRPPAARLRGLLAQAEWDRGRFDAAEAQLAAAFGAIEGADADAELAELHHIRLRQLVRQGDVVRVEQAAVAQLDLADRGGTPPAVVSAHLARADAAFLRGRFADAREHGLEALAVAEGAGLSVLAAQAHRHMAMTAANVGDHRLAREHALADLALARQTGSPTLELGGRFFVMAIDLVTDAWEEALGGAEELLAHGHRVGYARAVATGLAGRAFVLAQRGRPEEAARCVTEAREVYGAAAAADRHIFTVIELAEATAALAAGDPRRARERAAAAVATPTVLPCLGLTVLGEAQVAAGDPAGALGTARRLAGLGPGAPWPAACAGWVEGLARVALGERAAALAHFRQAADRLERLGVPFQAARARLGYAEVAAWVRIGDDRLPAGPINGGTTPAVPRTSPADAVEAARRSLATFDRLGARPSADRARRLLRALGERPAATPRAATGELSQRELQVVRLVAAGLSNAEIAARLFISPRTVTTHLQHVYTRLGLPSRTALARWVLDRGLAEDT
ncbi:MAG TPA: AAA family ATPase [Actinomycetota bacterium]|nr:AAA family ATPase [Actinomycetota bacterium]